MGGGRCGVHLLAWGADWNVPHFDLPRVFGICRQLGFAGIELPFLSPVPASGLGPVARAAAAEGLWLTASTALPADCALVDPDRADRAKRWLRQAVQAAAALGSPVLVGPMLAPVGELPSGPARALAPTVEHLAELTEFGAALGVRICIEPLTRYETDTLNTLAQGEELCHQVGGGLALTADTFHQNIEEANLLESWQAHLSVIGHVHFSENHRGPIGTGHIPWPDVVALLEEGGYRGRIVVEGFNGRVPELARATCIWHPRADSPEDFATHSAERLRTLRL